VIGGNGRCRRVSALAGEGQRCWVAGSSGMRRYVMAVKK